MARGLTPFQRKYWDADRLAILRNRWRTFEASEAICDLLNRTNADMLLPLNAYRCRQMAAWLRIKRPYGFVSVQHVRRRAAGTPGETRRIEFAIASAKLMLRREMDRRKRLAQKEKTLQEQRSAAERRTVPVMQRPAWMQPDAPAPKPKRRRGRPFSMQAIRGKDAGQRTVLERAARARIDGMFAQMKGRP